MSETERAVKQATACWNEHKHPFVWRRHRLPRRLRIAALPNLTLI